jgi:hypothetical protein
VIVGPGDISHASRRRTPITAEHPPFETTLNTCADREFARLKLLSAFTATHTIRTDVSANQNATANRYTQATGGATGQALASVTWVEAGGTTTWNAADVTWAASGGSIAADDAVVFDDTATAAVDALVCSIDFGGTQTAGDGTNFVITWNVSGIFTLAAV